MPNEIKFSQQQVSTILSDYQNGMGLRTIGRKFGCAAQVIEKCLLKNGINKRPLNPTIGKEAEIASLYEGGETLLSLSKRYKVQRSYIRAAVIAMGVAKRSHAEQQRKYHLKEDFFDNVDNEAKAYFLGFMYADGHNSKSGRVFELALQLRDRPILEIFKNCLEYEGSLRYDASNTNVCKLTVSSVKMCARLTELGCTPKKSFTLTFPEWMPGYLLHHFLRGYIDGDGWIAGVTGERINPVIGLLGTDRFIKSVAEIIGRNVGVKVTIRAHGVSDGIGRALISGANNCRKLADYLYSDATIYLTRKKDRAELIKPVGRLLGTNSKLAKLSDAQVKGIRNDRTDGLKREQLASKYLVSLSTIDRVIYGSRYY